MNERTAAFAIAAVAWAGAGAITWAMHDNVIAIIALYTAFKSTELVMQDDKPL